MRGREDEKLEDVLAEHTRSLHQDFFTALPGNVVKFDAATGCVDVRAGVKRPILDDTDEPATEALEIFPSVRVAWPGAGGFELRFPLVPGDAGLLVWSQWADAGWERTGQVSDPGDLRMHGEGYPKFFPFNRTSPSAFDGTHILTPTPLVVGGPAAQFVALSNLVNARFEAIETWLNAHTHPYINVLAAAVTSAPTPPIAPGASTAATKLKTL